jgi:hypothetical protein
MTDDEKDDDGLTPAHVERALDAKFRMDEATKRLNLIIERTNEMMRKINLGITVYTALADGWTLGWKRYVNGRMDAWMLVVFKAGTDELQTSTMVPLIETIRGRRIEALRAIPVLWERMLELAEERSAEFEATIAKLECFLNTWSEHNG